jgi:hypothetical protein
MLPEGGRKVEMSSGTVNASVDFEQNRDSQTRIEQQERAKREQEEKEKKERERREKEKNQQARFD